MTRVAIRIGPADHNRPMTLAEFRSADGQDGYRYELGRGIIAVTNVPNRRHFAMVNATRHQLSVFEVANPGVVQYVAAGSDCKVVLAGMDSERHPDWAVYGTAMPTDVANDEELWEAWIPDLVVEIVSPGSGKRDYEDKPEEYLRFGIPEYLVIDEDRQEMLAHRRRGGRYVTRVVRAGELYRSLALAGFGFDVAKVFEAARKTQV